MKNNHVLNSRGVYLLPNLLTTGAMFAGFYSIIAAINARYTEAAIAVLIAGVLDGLDGRVARATQTQTEFGMHYDSMSDLISFGMAPAILVFVWSLQSLAEFGNLSGKLGWLAAFLYCACAALRLARFNSQAHVADKRYFQGLASPAAAGTLVSTVWFCTEHGISGAQAAWPMLLLTTAVGLMMFTRLRYYSFKSASISQRGPLTWAFMLLLLFVLLAIDLSLMLMLIGFIYILSGALITWRGRQRRRSRNTQQRAHEADKDAP
jgi:CDP-diacylglycerol---serine O-phosphatidyltransferase